MKHKDIQVQGSNEMQVVRPRDEMIKLFAKEGEEKNLDSWLPKGLCLVPHEAQFCFLPSEFETQLYLFRAA